MYDLGPHFHWKALTVLKLKCNNRIYSIRILWLDFCFYFALIVREYLWGFLLLFSETRPYSKTIPQGVNCSQSYSKVLNRCYHDDIIKWKHFPRYWPFVRGIHRSPVNSSVTGEFPAQRPVTRSFDVFFDLRLNKRLETLVIWDAIAPIMTSLQCSLCAIWDDAVSGPFPAWTSNYIRVNNGV